MNKESRQERGERKVKKKHDSELRKIDIKR